jgi:hypothetical protein
MQDGRLVLLLCQWTGVLPACQGGERFRVSSLHEIVPKKAVIIQINQASCFLVSTSGPDHMYHLPLHQDQLSEHAGTIGSAWAWGGAALLPQPADMLFSLETCFFRIRCPRAISYTTSVVAISAPEKSPPPPWVNGIGKKSPPQFFCLGQKNTETAVFSPLNLRTHAGVLCSRAPALPHSRAARRRPPPPEGETATLIRFASLMTHLNPHQQSLSLQSKTRLTQLRCRAWSRPCR